MRQNSTLADLPDINIGNNMICERYQSNPITQAVVCGGLEPMDSFEELFSFIYVLRHEYGCSDDAVIYTGYTMKECDRNGRIQRLSKLGNIVIKFGRFVPNQKPHYDEIPGVNLVGSGQYAVKYNPIRK